MTGWGERPSRKRNRLQGYDYSRVGYYFITICTKNRVEYFGKIDHGEMVLNEYGMIAMKYWYEIPKHYNNVQLDVFVVMPNHIHGIIFINDDIFVGTEHCSVPTGKQFADNEIENGRGLLSDIIKSFKEICTKTIHINFQDYCFAWQRSFYDHIIGDERSFENIRSYIIDNPLNWKTDRNNIF